MPLPSRRRSVWTASAVAALSLGGLLIYASTREELYDPSFDARVDEPAYAGARPRVLFDEAHRNHHTAGGRYRPFADLVRNDGYEVESLRDPITVERLAGVSVLAVVCARGANDTDDAPAFTDAETEVVDRWVRAGGSLLLVTDHWPFGPAAESLARRFGVEMGKGLVQDPGHFEPGLEESHLVFSRDDGLLADHPITRGRRPGEQVRRVLTFTGQSLRGPADGVALLRLGETAVDRPPSPPRVERDGGDVRVSMDYGDPVPAGGRAQGVALEVGEGRVVVLGESGMLSAQRDGRGSPVGMNFPGYDNRQLALSIMHWLSRLL
jgi:hypothetical protein